MVTVDSAVSTCVYVECVRKNMVKTHFVTVVAAVVAIIAHVSPPSLNNVWSRLAAEAAAAPSPGLSSLSSVTTSAAATAAGNGLAGSGGNLLDSASMNILEEVSSNGGGGQSSPSLSSRVVHTKYGAVSGVIVQLEGRNLDPVEAFKGVPYASPPVGNLRFMPPVTGALWSGVKKADR